MSEGSLPRYVFWTLIGIAGFFVFIFLIIYFASFKSVGPQEVCVVQKGGINGKGVGDVRQPSTGWSSVGMFNGQKCFPASERQLRFTDIDEGDRDQAAYRTPTLDAVQVHVDGQARFVLNTDPETLKDFYKKYGVRTFGGKHPYDGDEGWVSFLNAVVVPVVQTSIREQVGERRCIELNNQCQYVQNVEAATKGDVKEVHQELDAVASDISEQLSQNINATLGGNYFDRVRFSVIRMGFDNQVQVQISESQAKRAELAKAELEAQRQQREAHGKFLVARENAKAIKEKAKAYTNNPAQAKIDLAEAICGSTGCTGLRVLGGGNVMQLIR